MGAVAARGEVEKRTKYQALLSEFDFVPVALESSGVLGAAGKDRVREIGGRIAFRSDNKEARAFLMRRISIEVQRGNATMVDINLPARALLTEFFDVPQRLAVVPTLKFDVCEQCRDACLNGELEEKHGNRFLAIKTHSVCFNQVSRPRFSPMEICLASSAQ